MEQIRCDDIEALRAKISDEMGPFGQPLEVTQDMINQFAELTGDHQWIHVDVEKAKEGPFGTTIAHGFLTLSLLPTLGTRQSFEITGVGNATNYGADKLRFVSPVPAGSSLHACSRLMAVEAKPKGTQITTEIAIHVVGHDRPAVVYQMIVLYHPAG